MADEQIATPPSSSGGYSNKRPLWQWIALYVVIGVLVYGLLYYFVLGKKGGYSQTAVTPSPIQAGQNATTTPQTSPTTESMTKQEVTIVGKEFSFTPSTFSVKLNTPVTITFKNEGKYPHNLTITDLAVKTKTIQPGAEDTITFTPTKAGTFSFLCTVPGHADQGMTGTLTVK